MAEATGTVGTPTWVDLATSDPEAARAFYARLFGWQIEVNPDPQYGGYALARLNGKDVAGIGGLQDPNAPTAWSLYIGTPDAEELGRKVTAAGGTVVAPAFDVGDQGRMAVFQDPSGAFISCWQKTAMGGFGTEGSNTFGWAELNARGVDRAIEFYETVFGWTRRDSDMPGGSRYTEFLKDGTSILGAWEMDPNVPAGVPSHWLIYFSADDVDAKHRDAVAAGATEMMGSQDFPGGRFSIVSDPQGAQFGLLRTTQG